MVITYDTYYQTQNLFGDPYPELIAFFTRQPKPSRILDLGCGQGRNAIALARLGFSVTGVDHSQVGLAQMTQLAQAENLQVTSVLGDIYAFDGFYDFDIILLDSIFHFTKKDKEKEEGLLKRIVSEMRRGALIVVCIQDTGDKVRVLHQALDAGVALQREGEQKFNYRFEDAERGHVSETVYRMVIAKKD